MSEAGFSKQAKMSWSRFNEFKDLKPADKSSKNTSKRRNSDASDLKTVKRRRKSLFSTYSSSQLSKANNTAHDFKIAHFSSSDDEEQIGKSINQFSERKDKTGAKYPQKQFIKQEKDDEEQIVNSINQFSERKYKTGANYPQNQFIKQENDDDEQIGNSIKQFSERKAKTGAKVSDTTNTSSKLGTLKRRQSAPVFLLGSQNPKNPDVIDWSDSDNDIDNEKVDSDQANRALSTAVNFCKTEPSQSSQEAPKIDTFDSPLKSNRKKSTKDLIFNSQESIQDSSPSQKLLLINPNEIKQEKDDDYMAKLVDSSKKKRREVKGGLAEQLRKVVSRENSELAFWSHSHDADARTETALVLKVIHEIRNYSLQVLKCQTIESDPQQVYLLMPCSKWRKTQGDLQSTFLKIHPPWKKLKLDSSDITILLCVYFYEILQDFSQGSNVCDNSLQDGQNLEEVVALDSGLDEVFKNFITDHKNPKSANIDTSLHLSEFSKCIFLRKCCFSATVKRVFMSTENALPILPTRSDIGLIKCIQYARRRTKVPNIALLVKDVKNIFAVVNLTFPLLLEAVENEDNFWSSEGCKLNLQNFVLSGVKSAYTDPALFSLINELSSEADAGGIKQENVDTALSNKCLVFSFCDESSLSSANYTIENNSQRENICKVLDREQIHRRNSLNRISGFSRFVCTVPDKNTGCDINSQQHRYLLILLVDPGNGINRDSILDSNEEISLLEMLPSFYLPSFITESLMDENVYFFKDLLVQNGNLKLLVADQLSRIFFGTSRSDEAVKVPDDSISICSSRYLSENEHNTLMQKPVPVLNRLSTNTAEKTMTVVEGVIVSIDDENALCWTVCSSCKTETEDAIKSSEFFCTFCDKNVERKMCVQLEVFLENPDLKNFKICIKLLEETVFDYLPMPISDSFQGFDVDCILGKKFGPSACFVTERKANLSASDKFSIKLVEMRLPNHLEKCVL